VVTLIGPYENAIASATSIPVLRDHDPSGLTVIYSLQVPNLQPSNIVHVVVEAEVSNNTGKKVVYEWSLIRATSDTSTTGTYLKTPVEMSFISVQHHFVTELWSFDTGMPAGTYYYNLVASSKNAGILPGKTLTVEQGLGAITAMVYTP
jgi:hypothetical protein